MASIKLEQYIAAQTSYSRRDIFALIKEEKIRCNGKLVTSITQEINPTNSHVVVDGTSLLTPPTFYYYKYYKSRNMICTLSDPKDRRCLQEVITKLKQPVFPVGRLDRQTTGLLLLTNDGHFSQKIIHPSQSIKKQYSVTLSKTLDRTTLIRIESGFFLEDGPVEFQELSLTDANQMKVTLLEGRNRLIRRAFEFLGYEVTHLKRLSIGPITLGKLKMGEIRPLTPTEINRINTL
jgi:23S rRNA pseudouridine2605 synthase